MRVEERQKGYSEISTEDVKKKCLPLTGGGIANMTRSDSLMILTGAVARQRLNFLYLVIVSLSYVSRCARASTLQLNKTETVCDWLKGEARLQNDLQVRYVAGVAVVEGKCDERWR